MKTVFQYYQIQLKGKTPINLLNTSIIFGITKYTGELIDFNNLYIEASLYKTNHNFDSNGNINRTQIKIKLICDENNNPNYLINQINLNKSQFLCIKKPKI